MTLRDALIVLIDATAGLPGSDRQGDPLFSARCRAKWTANQLLLRAERRFKEAQRPDMVSKFIRDYANLDPKWIAWHQQVLNGHAKKGRGGFRLVREKASE